MNQIETRETHLPIVTLPTNTKEHIENAKAINTKKAYKSDWNDFASWCENNGLCALPAIPETVIIYITHLAEERGYKASTIQRRITTISQAHQAKELASPTQIYTVRVFLKGLRRSIGTAQEGKAPVMLDHIKAMVNALPSNLLGIRDRALLLIGWAGARRRSEIVAFNVEDLKFSEEGLTLTIRRSKTNQEGQEEKISIWYGANPDTCPVRALKRWLEEANITEGAVFRSINRHGHIGKRLSDKGVAIVVKRSAEAIGLDSTEFAGHSLRAGLATQSARSGLSERSIMKQTGHKSVSVVRRYIREGSLFVDNVTANLGL